MQRDELGTWLGDEYDLTNLTEAQLGRLHSLADAFDEWCDSDYDPEPGKVICRTAYRIVTGDDSVIAELSAARAAAKRAEELAMAGLEQAAYQLISVEGSESEAGFARRAKVDRMTVRKWRRTWVHQGRDD